MAKDQGGKAVTATRRGGTAVAAEAWEEEQER